MSKVLFIHHGSEKGGAPISLLYTALGVSDYGYQPVIGLVRPTKGLHRLYNEAGFRTVEMTKVALYIYWSSSNHPMYHPRAYIKLAKFLGKYKQGQRQLEEVIKTEKIDLVHLNSMALSSSASLLSKIGQPFVWHIREYGPKIRDFRWRRLAELMREVPAVIFLSEAERQSWIGSPTPNATVVYNFVNVDDFQAREQSANNPKQILFVGGLKENKGAEILIETLGLLVKKGIAFQCIMPGSLTRSEIDPKQSDTAFEQKLLQRAKSLGVIKHLKRTAFNPDIRALFSSCDLLLFPAKFPHFARPVVEASAMKKPVIASDLPPLDEQVIDKETGFLVPYDAKAFANKIEILFNDASLSASMGAAGRKLVEQNFNAASQIEKIVEVYNRILRR